MIKQYSGNIYTDFYINAAKKLNISYRLLPEHKYTYILRKNNKTLFISNAVLGVNNFLSHQITNNKYKTYLLFDLENIPHPKAIKIKDLKKIKKKVKDLNKPIVVKPIIGFGGHGVTVKINNPKQLKKAIKFAKKFKNEIIIEEFINGEDYRILLFRDKIIDIVKRIPANIKGNGKDSINILINRKNDKRKSVGLKKIRFDNELNKELKSKKLTLESKPEKGKKLYLRKNCNMASGGETKRVPLKKVHKDNKKLFIKAANFLNLNFAGIDFISKDITKSYRNNSASINEINRFPSLDVHYFADMKMDNSVAENILSTYFKY